MLIASQSVEIELRSTPSVFWMHCLVLCIRCCRIEQDDDDEDPLLCIVGTNVGMK